MMKVDVSITNISAERFWDIRKPAPNIQINTNISIVAVKKSDDILEVPYLLTVNYNPSLAQISLKGNAFVSGDKAELDKIWAEYEQKKPPPPFILQSISNLAFTEAVLISRIMNVPPPIPFPSMTPPEGKGPTAKPGQRDYSA
jgi:hypothetical protein